MSKVISETGTLAELKAFADKLEQNGISFGELSRSATLREATMKDSLRGSSTVEHLPVKQGDAGSSPACAAAETQSEITAWAGLPSNSGAADGGAAGGVGPLRGRFDEFCIFTDEAFDDAEAEAALTEREYTFPLMVEVISETGTQDELEQAIGSLLITNGAEAKFVDQHGREPTPEEFEPFRAAYVKWLTRGLLEGNWGEG